MTIQNKGLLLFLIFSYLFLLNARSAIAMELFSSSFKAGQAIPAQYTCDGADISPDLKWQNIPAGTKSLVLILDDPDAPGGIWDHWIVFNIPPAIKGIPEGAKIPPTSSMGKNSWGTTEYRGPCPPDTTHRYFFRLYALDTVLKLAPGSSKAQVKMAMQGHVLANTELMGTYDRNR